MRSHPVDVFIERYPPAIQDPDFLGCRAEHIVFNVFREHGCLVFLQETCWLVPSFKDLRDVP